MTWDMEHNSERTSCKRAHAHFNANARVYDLCVCICARIFMKFETKVHKIVIDYHIKYLSFRCGDICKTVQAFV